MQHMQHIVHWPVGLIYHKYLASKIHFDTLNDLKRPYYRKT